MPGKTVVGAFPLIIGKIEEAKIGGAMLDEFIGICVVCNKRIEKGSKTARMIDGVWLCNLHCLDKFLEEKKKWTPENWVSICRMQALYEERKRAETSNLRNSSVK